ncbi:MAG: AAA family ATPase [Treponema sp.]|nr:AAA family ATPase [Treponema sp.]
MGIENKNLKTRFRNLLMYLNTGLFEKENPIRLSLLCAIAGESIFFLGPPGTAKSMISRRLQKAFKGESNYFEYLMNEFSTPDEICGPVSLKSLEHDSYIRKTEGFLPTANIAFLDEIWKSGPAILNTLLTLINEKKFHNGSNVEKVPLKILLAASNELPAQDSGLEALYDRFIIRLMVNPVTNKNDFNSLITSTSKESLPKDFESSNLICLDEIDEWQNQIDKVEVPELVLEVIHSIRNSITNYNESIKIQEIKNEKDEDDDFLEDEEEKVVEEEKNPIYVSDRRWKKIIHLLRTSAFINGRNKVDFSDCSLIWNCLWSLPEEIPHVKEWTASAISKVLVGQTNIDNFIKKIENYRQLVQKHFLSKTKYEFVMEKLSQYGRFFKTIFRGKNYWFAVPTDFERDNENKIYKSRTICESLYEPAHFAEYTINLDKEIITVLNPIGRLKDVPYKILTCESPMKMSEIYESYDDYIQDVANFEEANFYPLKNELQSLIKEMEVYFSTESEEINLFMDESFKNALRDKLDECEKSIKKLIFNLNKIQSLYEWDY